MSGFEDIREHMEVIGADGVHIGTVDRVEDDRIKLIRADSGIAHTDHHHYIPRGLVAEVEGDQGAADCPRRRRRRSVRGGSERQADRRLTRRRTSTNRLQSRRPRSSQRA